MKILHVMYQSLPDIMGSTIRSRDILFSLSENGVENIVITPIFQRSVKKNMEVEYIQGIKYYRGTTSTNLYSSDETKTFKQQVKKFFTLFEFYGRIERIIKTEKPDLIHAHAMFYCFLPSYIASKRYDIPCIYEVRSIWEEMRTLTSQNIIENIITKLLKKIETVCFHLSRHIVVINKNLKNEIINRSVKENKILIVPNSIILKEPFKKPVFNDVLRIGYVGGLVKHEGILEFLQLLECNNNLNKIEFHIYGKGPEEDTLKYFVNKNQMKNVIFYGQVVNEKITKVYENIDIIILPRLHSKLTDSVTPLKPIEAMHNSTMVIGSNVGGLRELITHKITGIIFEDEKELVEYLYFFSTPSSINIRRRIVKDAYNFVREEKNWLSNSVRYINLYSSLIKCK